MKNTEGVQKYIQVFVKYSYYIALFWCLLGFICLPMINTFQKSLETKFGTSFENYVNYFNINNNWVVLNNTLMLGIATVIVCGIIGTGLAIYMNFVEVKHFKILHTLLLTPMMVPGVIIVIAFIQLYGESGVITKSIQWLFNMDKVPYQFMGFWGILFVHAYTQYVYFYLNVSIALKFVDYSTLESSRGLGATKWGTFKNIILPRIQPAIFASSIVSFISGISSFSAPNLLGGRYSVLSTQIMRSKSNNYMNLASMQVVILMIMGLVVMLLARYYEEKYALEVSVRAQPIEKVVLTHKGISWIFNLMMFGMVILITLPIVTIILFSFVKSSSMMVDIFPREFVLDNYRKMLMQKRVLKPIINSISMSFIAMLVNVLISVPVAYFATKKKNKINKLIELLFMLPWAMPVSTIAINLINAFNTRNVFVGYHILIGTFWILPLAYIVASIPLMLRTNMVAFENFNLTLEDASKSLGANRMHTFYRVTAPIVAPAIFSGSALVFIRMIGEYTMSALLYGVGNKPISIAMVNAMQEYDMGLSMAYGVLTISICFLAMGFILRMNDQIV